MEPLAHFPDTGTKPIQYSENSQFMMSVMFHKFLGKHLENQEPDEKIITHTENCFYETGTSSGLTPVLKYLVVWTSVLLKLCMGRMEKIIFLR